MVDVMKNILVSGLVVTFFLVVSAANAAIVYDNGGPSTDSAYGIKGTQEVRDDFTLASDTEIGSVGFYFQTSGDIAGWNEDITYNIYSNTDALMVTGSGQNVTFVDSGLPWCCGGNAFLVTFDLESSLPLLSGTYWLGLTGATGIIGANENYYWVTSGLGNGKFNTNPLVYGFAFYLEDAAVVPLPASVFLFGTSLLSLVGVHRKSMASARGVSS